MALGCMMKMVISSTVNDLDLSLGSFISFVACVAATLLDQHPVLGCLALLGCIAVVVPSFTEAGCAQMLAGLQSVLQPAGFQLTLSESQRDEEREANMLENLLSASLAALAIRAGLAKLPEEDRKSVV